MKAVTCVHSLAALLALRLICGPAYAASDLTGDQLASLCRADKNSANWGYCVGYIKGVAEWIANVGMDRNEDGTALRPRESLCPKLDPGFDTNVMISLFLSWAETHPQELLNSASFVVGDALQQKWPCKS
jgi:hypothetical protein